MRDLPRLCDIIAGSLYICLRRGWFSISCQCFIRMFLRLGTDGWYCAIKGKMVFPLEGFFWRASFLFSKRISERIRVIKFRGYPLSLRCFWNSSSRFWKFSSLKNLLWVLFAHFVGWVWTRSSLSYGYFKVFQITLCLVWWSKLRLYIMKFIRINLAKCLSDCAMK